MTKELFHRRILNAAAENAESTALSDAETGEKITFSALYTRTNSLAQILYSQYGLRKGDTIVCFMPNNVHYPIIFLASALIGAPFCGICSSASKTEISEWLNSTSCKILFTTSELLEKVIQKTDEMSIPVFVSGKVFGQPGIDLEGTFEEISLQNIDSSFLKDDNLSDNDVLLMALSSGTTGTPKCVLLSHKNFNAATNALKFAVFDKLSARGKQSRATIALLPFYHASGFWALCYCLLSGHHSIVLSRFDTATFLRTISENAVDTINLVPSIINFLIKNGRELIEQHAFDLSSVKTILCGSAAINNEQVSEFLDIFPHVTNFLRGYGMTEIVVLSHITPLDMTEDEIIRHANSCGKLLPGFEGKIVDIETGKEISVANVPGELWLKSECVMLGYLNKSSNFTDEDDYYHTGDIAYFDEDGFYYINGRLKNIIKVNGMQVSPIELENILISHPDVLEAAVIGIEDEDRGEVPKAYIILATSFSSLEMTKAKINEIGKFVHERVAPFKQLHGGIVPVATLPKTSSGKTSRIQLKEWSHEFPATDKQLTEITEQKFANTLFLNNNIPLYNDENSDHETIL